MPKIVPEAAYLTPTIGTATTPDPGPLPNPCTFVFKVRGPIGTSGQRIVSHWPTAGNLSWTLYRRNDLNRIGALVSADGTTTALQIEPSSPIVTHEIEHLAYSLTSDNGANSVARSWGSPDGGATWQPLAPLSGARVTPFDSTGPVRIGAQGTATALWDDRIYSVELRTGLDPAAGAVVWRFDADDYPGTGTVYTDPRGRQWTLTSAAAITPRVPNAYFGDLPVLDAFFDGARITEIELPVG